MKKNDFILISIIVAIAIIAFVLINTVFTDKGGNVEVLVDGNVVEKFSLNENVNYKIESENGYNELVIEDGKASIVEASCPDKLCIHQKSISSAGESIICLPNKVVVRIVGDTASDIDSIAN